MGDCIGIIMEAIQEDTRILDYGSCTYKGRYEDYPLNVAFPC